MEQKYIIAIGAFTLGIALAFSIAAYVNSANQNYHYDGEHPEGCPMMDGDHDHLHNTMEDALGEGHFDDDHHQEMHERMMGLN